MISGQNFPLAPAFPDGAEKLVAPQETLGVTHHDSRLWRKGFPVESRMHPFAGTPRLRHFARYLCSAAAVCSGSANRTADAIGFSGVVCYAQSCLAFNCSAKSCVSCLISSSSALLLLTVDSLG